MQQSAHESIGWPEVVDLHTHILPGIDDGSRDVDMSLGMLRAMTAQGIRRVVATPHFYAAHDNPARFLDRRQRAYERLAAAMDGLDVEVRVGAEVYYFEGISDCEDLDALAISGTKAILIEMPMPPWSERMLQELQEIRQKRGLTPIVAHIDRYIAPLRTHGIPQMLARYPVLVQANSEFFIRRSTRRMALRMLTQGQIHLLGSDCHGLTHRPPNLDQAIGIIARKLGPEALRTIERTGEQVLG